MNTREDLTTSITPCGSATDHWATALVQRAARRAPAELSERLEEEWLADLAAQPNALSRLRFALGCCWARQVISFDPVAFGVTEQHAAAGHGAVAALAPHDVSFMSQRTLLLLLIVAMHGVLIYGFANGLGSKVMEKLPPTIKAIWISEPRPIEKAPPLSPPDTSHWPMDRLPDTSLLPDPVPRIQITEDSPTPLYLPPETPAGDTRPIAHPVTRVLGGPGTGFPNTADYYPPQSRQLGEQGVAAVQVCVDTHGRLVKDPEIRDSSGNPRLDAGAIALAKAASGHYRSTTEDGQPVSSCYAFRLRFQLKQ